MFLLHSFIYASDNSIGKSTSNHVSSPGFFVSIIPVVAIFLICYFLIIRPNKKQAIKHSEMVNSVKKGDKVFLQCGMIGTVAKIEDGNIAIIEIAQGVFCKFNKYTISYVVKDSYSSTNMVQGCIKSDTDASTNCIKKEG